MDDRRELHSQLTAPAASTGRAALPAGGTAAPLRGRILRRRGLGGVVPAEHAGVERKSHDCGRENGRDDDNSSHQ